MDIEGKPRSAERGLVNAEGALREAADAHPFLEGHGRAFRRIARVANRPPRIAILGETNSGKSSLANLLAGIWVLPAHPVETTRLPGLLKYAPVLSVTAVCGNGERIEIPLGRNIAEAMHRYDGGPSGDGSGGPAGIEYMELGLPSALLRSVEIVDFPAGRMDVAGLGMDAAIWTTVATQAWRESERARWLEVPRAVRARSLLAVTFCDLIAGENDRKKLRARLEISAKQYFQDICFVTNGDEKPSTAASANMVLFARVQDLARDFAAQRQAKATAIARRVVKYTFEKREDSEREAAAAIARKFAPEAGTGLFPGDWAAGLNSPVLEAGLEKPPVTPGRRNPGAAAKTPGRKLAVAPHSSAPGQSLKERPASIAAVAMFVLVGFAAAAAFHLALMGTGKVAVSNSAPGASEAAGQASAEARGKAEAEAAAAESRREAEVEAAAAEARGKAQAEAVAAEARKKAEAEAAAAEARGKAQAEAAAVEARQKAEVEAAAAEAAATEARKKAEAAAAAEARRKAEAAATEAERRRRATPQQAPYRPGGNNVIIHGE